MWTLVRGQWVSANVGLGTPPAATPGVLVAAHELAVEAAPAVRQDGAPPPSPTAASVAGLGDRRRQI